MFSPVQTTTPQARFGVTSTTPFFVTVPFVTPTSTTASTTITSSPTTPTPTTTAARVTVTTYSHVVRNTGDILI